MRKVHMVLQGKGGVGKSTVAVLLGQYKKDCQKRPALCIDTDPQNQTLSGWSGLNTKHIDLVLGGDFAKERFDLVISAIAESETDVIVDTGSNGFLPITSYMRDNEVPESLRLLNCRLLIHSVLVGGEAAQDTLDGLVYLSKRFPHVPTIVWINGVFGPVETEDEKLEFDEEFRNIEKLAIIRLPDYGDSRASTFGRDLNRMLTEKLTFEEARVAFKSEVMPAHRAGMMRDKFFLAIAEVDAGDTSL